MADLSNSNNWLKIYDSFHVAQVRDNQPERHYPILPIIIPTVLDNFIVAVSSKPSNPKATWTYAGKVYPLINIGSSDFSVGKYSKYYPIDLNQITIIKIAKVSSYYRLLIQVPKWFVDVYLQIWVFTGNEPIDSIEENINQIKSQLNRIEEQINTSTSQ